MTRTACLISFLICKPATTAFAQMSSTMQHALHANVHVPEHLVGHVCAGTVVTVGVESSQCPNAECLQVFGHQSLVEQLLLDLDFSWNGNQKFQLKVSRTMWHMQNVLWVRPPCCGSCQ